MCLNSPKWSTSPVFFLSSEGCVLYSYSSPASCFRAAHSESFMSVISLINSVESRLYTARYIHLSVRGSMTMIYDLFENETLLLPSQRSDYGF